MKTLLDIPLDSICAKQRNAHKVTNLYEYTTQNTKENIKRKKPSFSFFREWGILPLTVHHQKKCVEEYKEERDLETGVSAKGTEVCCFLACSS